MFAPSTALLLPVLDASIVTRFTYETEAVDLQNVALWLAELGVMETRHWRGNTANAVRASLSALATVHRPQPLVSLNLAVVADPEIESSEVHHRHPKATDPVHALAVGIPAAEPRIARHLGRTFAAIERQRPGQGKALLRILDHGLESCTRALTPWSGLGWAQGQYWRGEDDESFLLEEEMAEYRSDRAGGEFAKMTDAELRDYIIAEHHIITRAGYLKSFPNWAVQHSGFCGPRKPERLSRSLPPAVRAAALRVDELTRQRPKQLNDLNCCNNGAWDACPFLLQWDEETILPQLWDDVMNNHFECGEVDLSLNALFIFWDVASLRHAVDRLAYYLRLTQACETLLRELRIKLS